MKTIKISKLLLIVTAGALVLTSCYTFGPTAVPTQPGQVETSAAGTVSARLTQIAFETLAAQVTQQPGPTSPPAPTFTLAPTATPLPPTPTPIPPTATAIPIPCNQAYFIGDTTVPDGSLYTAAETFIKTWRVKNIGTCSWTKDYFIYFAGGESLSAPASVGFPNIVNPGEIVDLSVSMVAPSALGNHTGSWMLKSSTGTVFGVGASRSAPLTVNIKVVTIPDPKDPFTTYDFVKNYCSAQWRTNAGYITCPSTKVDFSKGSINRSYFPILENGIVDDEGAIISIPAVGGDGFIRGQFPKMVVHDGDFFISTLLCSYNMKKCSVTFELLYQVNGSSTITSLGTWKKVYDNSTVDANVDLSSLDGKDVIFYLKVSSQGEPTDDMAQWMAARITHPLRN
jgi:hypothetical protein